MLKIKESMLRQNIIRKEVFSKVKNNNFRRKFYKCIFISYIHHTNMVFEFSMQLIK